MFRCRDYQRPANSHLIPFTQAHVLRLHDPLASFVIELFHLFVPVLIHVAINAPAMRSEPLAARLAAFIVIFIALARACQRQKSQCAHPPHDLRSKLARVHFPHTTYQAVRDERGIAWWAYDDAEVRQ